MASSSDGEPEEDIHAHKDPDRPLTKKEKIANSFRDELTGLVYIKFFQHAKNITPFDYNGFKLHNIIDVYALRKRLYTMKDINKADFETILGNNFSEFRFGGEDDIDFHSNFDSGNLFRVIKGEDGIYYCEMMPDTNSMGHENWFHFTTSHMVKGQKCIFRVINFRKKDLMVNKIFYKSKRDERKYELGWRIVPDKCSFISNDENPEMFDDRVKNRIKGMYTLEFSFEYGSDDDQISFALAPPYTYEDLQVDSFLWSHKMKKSKN